MVYPSNSHPISVLCASHLLSLVPRLADDILPVASSSCVAWISGDISESVGENLQIDKSAKMIRNHHLLVIMSKNSSFSVGNHY